MLAIARARLALVTILLALAYYYLLIVTVGWIGGQHFPSWWFSVFSDQTKHVGFTVWIITQHSVAVVGAAIPVAIGAVLLARPAAVQVGLLTGLIAAVAALVPPLTAGTFLLEWGAHPVFFVTDQIKVIFAVPFFAWVLRAASSNNRLERPGSFGELRG